MAPRKRKPTEQEEELAAKFRAELAALVAQDSARRVTRSSTRVAAAESSAEPPPVAPPRKKAKGAQKKKEPEKKEEAAGEEAEGEAVKEEKENSGGSKAEAKAGNKNEKGKQKVEDGGEAAEDDGDESDKRTIVIEHCKQCKSFKTRADQVKDGLEKGVPGITVLLNPDKPRKGCFEIREEGGETFISLLDMPRPFSKMKALNMEEVIGDIIEKIK